MSWGDFMILVYPQSSVLLVLNIEFCRFNTDNYRKWNLNGLLPIDIGNILFWGKDLKWDNAVIWVSLTYFFFFLVKITACYKT